MTGIIIIVGDSNWQIALGQWPACRISRAEFHADCLLSAVIFWQSVGRIEQRSVEVGYRQSSHPVTALTKGRQGAGLGINKQSSSSPWGGYRRSSFRIDKVKTEIKKKGRPFSQ